jgi:hypothetical protein
VNGHLAAQAVVDSLAQFQDHAGWFPAAVVGPLDQQRAAVVVGDDGGDADRVPGTGVHVITSRGARAVAFPATLVPELRPD